jgi:hypothetical protein
MPLTFLRAVQRGHYASWPSLTPLLISKHLPKSLATSKGHLRMQQKNLRSTKIASNILPLNVSLNINLSQEPSNARTQSMFATIL